MSKVITYTKTYGPNWKSCGTFKERSNWYIRKNYILFPERRSLFEDKNNNIWVQMKSW